MSKLFILVLMIFCHVVDDYYLQGILAQMKQKKWWNENAPNPLYKHDYIVALITHGFSWAFMVMLPIAIALDLGLALPFWVCFGANVIIHAFIDNLKANKLKINLVVDQTAHIVQICVTYFYYDWFVIPNKRVANFSVTLHHISYPPTLLGVVLFG